MLEVQKVEMTEEQKEALEKAIKEGAFKLGQAIAELPEVEEVELGYETSDRFVVTVPIETYDRLIDRDTRFDILVGMVHSASKRGAEAIDVDVLRDVLSMNEFFSVEECDSCKRSECEDECK